MKGIGSLVGRSAGHGVLYGPDQREAVLYRNQAAEKMRGLGKLFRGEEDILRERAMETGRDTIREAFAERKVTRTKSEGEALAMLPGEIERVLRQLGAR